MRRTITIAATAALALGLVAGPATAAKPEWAGPGNGSTIVDTAIAASEIEFDDDGAVVFDDEAGDFDILVAAVLATGATSVLNGEDEYTVFAPTDQAFIDLASFLAGTDLDEAGAFQALLDLQTDGQLDILAVLTFHITEGWRPSPSVVNAKKIEMLDGNTISAPGGMIETSSPLKATIVGPDLKTNDGGIHVISAVLVP